MALYLGVNNDGSFVSSDGNRLQDSNGLSLYALPETSEWKIIINNIAYYVNVNLGTKESE